MSISAGRDLDIVLLGATGFTGGLVAERLARSAPTGLRWGLAGRSPEKLDAVRERLGVDVPVVVTDLDDAGSVRELAERARVLATTVGPYVELGDAVVGACAAAGTDYADITGESEFVDRTWLRHHAVAERTGARLVHACGFDSVPHDLGAQHAVQQLPPDVPIRLRGYVRAGGAMSGGTFASALGAMSRVRQSARVHAERRAAERVASDGGSRTARALTARPGYDRDAGCWVLPLPTLDPQVVARSARALPEFGPDFRYTHLAALNSPVSAVGLATGAAGAFALAQLPPARRLLMRALPSGNGPSQERRRRSWFTVRFIGTGGGRRVVTEVAGGDPGYAETAVMLAESALCLATDDLPDTAGQVTTAVAMGEALRARLERADITFRVVEAS